MSLTITRPTIPVPLPLTRGGTDATTASEARANLELGDLALLTAPGGTSTFLRADTTWAVPPGGGGGAPTDAEYITSTANASLSAERVLTDTATITWDRTTAGQIKAHAIGGGGGAPTDAEYITSVASAGLSVERVLADSATITWDRSVAGQITAHAIGGGYTDEQAQDAIGAMLLDTATIDLTYTDATPSLSASVIDGSITEAKLSLTDVTTKDASTTAHGLLRKLSGTATQYLDGSGAWTTPAGGANYWSRTSEPSTLATGLLALWNLEEASGNRLDSVGTNHLVPQGTVAQITNAAGKIGQALAMNATAGTYLSVADNATLSAGPNMSFTLACWVYVNSATSTKGLVGKGSASVNNNTLEYLLYQFGASWSFVVGGGASFVEVISPTAPVASTWTLLIGWYDHVADIQYLQVNNGTPTQIANTVGSHDSALPFEVGRMPGTSLTLNGRLDLVAFAKRVWTAQERTDYWNGGNGLAYPFGAGTGLYVAPLTATDSLLLGATRVSTERLEVDGAIKVGTTTGTTDGIVRWTGTDMEARKGGAWVSMTGGGVWSRNELAFGSALNMNLMACWRMEEASGNRLDSVSGQALVPSGTVANIGSTTGKLGTAVTFAGASYLSIPDSIPLSVGLGTSFTVAFWVYFTSFGVTHGLVGKGNTGALATEWSFVRQESGGRIQFLIGSGTANLSAEYTTITPGLNSWYFVVGWYNAATHEQGIQLNSGAPIIGTNLTGAQDTTGPLEVGRMVGITGNELQGRVDQLSLWKRCLSQAEIAALYAAGAGLEYPFAGGPAGTVGMLTPLVTTDMLRLQPSTATPTDIADGTMRWSGTDLEGRTGGAWVSMTGAGASAYTDEQAQDAVGTILVDSATIDLTYTDATPALTAAIVAGSVGTTQLTNDGVTYAKLQNVTDARLLGRSAGSAGDAQEITVGSGLSLSAGALTSTGQPLDATLTALAGLTTGADQLPYATGTDMFAQTTLTSFARTLLDDTSQAAMRTTLALTPGTDVQAQDATLTALAGLTTGANLLPYFTGVDTVTTTTLSAFARTVLDDADAATMRGTISAQTSDATLTALAGLATGADQLPYFTGTDTAAQTPLTAAGRTLAGAADAAAQRTALALGTMAQQDASAVAITGGTVGVASVATNDLTAYGTSSLTVTNVNGAAVFSSTVSIPTAALQLGTGTPTSSARIQIFYLKNTAYGLVLTQDNDGGAFPAIEFRNAAGTGVGYIFTTATTTSYNTTSDVRLKHAITPLTGALDVVQRLRPVGFRWHADDSPGVGYLAHELMQVVPEAVTGLPDEVNEDGSVKPQGVDHSKLVPWLTAALQDTLAQVQALQARVATLEEQLGL